MLTPGTVRENAEVSIRCLLASTAERAGLHDQPLLGNSGVSIRCLLASTAEQHPNGSVRRYVNVSIRCLLASTAELDTVAGSIF